MLLLSNAEKFSSIITILLLGVLDILDKAILVAMSLTVCSNPLPNYTGNLLSILYTLYISILL